jgi:hypothetical protein
MKNGNLIVQGQEAQYFLNTCEFTKIEEFFRWENDARYAYNSKKTKEEYLHSLEDLFGENFSKTFYHLKNILVLNFSMRNIIRDINYLEQKRRKMEDLYLKDYISNDDIDIYFEVFKEKGVDLET